MLQDHCNSCSEAVILLLGDGQNKPKVVAWKDRQLNHSALFPNLLLLVVGDTRYCLLPDHLNAVDLEVCQLSQKPVHSLRQHADACQHAIGLRVIGPAIFSRLQLNPSISPPILQRERTVSLVVPVHVPTEYGIGEASQIFQALLCLIHTFFAVHLIPLRRCRAWAL